MYGMFFEAISFDRDLSNWDVSNVAEIYYMFKNADSFNQNLCTWKDNFPYLNATYIFANTSCTYQDTPDIEQNGPFCDSLCN
jgi:surface protein